MTVVSRTLGPMTKPSILLPPWYEIDASLCVFDDTMLFFCDVDLCLICHRYGCLHLFRCLCLSVCSRVSATEVKCWEQTEFASNTLCWGWTVVACLKIMGRGSRTRFQRPRWFRRHPIRRVCWQRANTTVGRYRHLRRTSTLRTFTGNQMVWATVPLPAKYVRYCRYDLFARLLRVGSRRAFCG